MRSKMWSAIRGVAVATLLGSVNPALADEIDDKIAKFAAARVGQKVGDGHSTRLVEQALYAAGAKPGRDLQWGSTERISALHPGYIIQFKTRTDSKTFKVESCVFTNPSNGATWNLTGYPAVVEKLSGGNKVTILYQNGDGSPVSENARVQRLELDLRWKKSGKYQLYKPVNAPQWAELGPKIVSFAASQVDHKVADGRSSKLVEQALVFAGGKPGSKTVWGTPGGSALYPGDIIQFKSAGFKNSTGEWQFGHPNHTAIVEKAWGTKVTLLHQDFDFEPRTKNSRVRRFELDVKWMKSGDYKVYQPMPK